jgi:hypothetical protein
MAVLNHVNIKVSNEIKQLKFSTGGSKKN